MPVIRRIQKRGSTITVEAYGEVLFMPGGPVYGWTRRLEGRIKKFTIAAAPANKRPRWAHYGKPLKSTIFMSRPQFRLYAGVNPRIYAQIGSTAPHAMYVNEGTGVYAGNSPWKAKILPPWSRGDNSLYEHTWRPGGPGTPKVAPVMIKGQKPQYFLDKGLIRGMESMRLRSFKVPEGARITDIFNMAPPQLQQFLGPQQDSGFQASLDQWRKWRDDAWAMDLRMNRSRYDAEAARERAENRAKRLPKPAFSKPIGPIDNRAAFAASLAAAEKRKRDQAAKVADERRRKAEGERKRAEAEAKRLAKEKHQNEVRQALREAKAYYDVMKAAYPNARLVGPAKTKSGLTIYRVKWTDSEGHEHHQDFGA